MMMRKILPKLFCSKCGARADATCACGVAYMPARVAAAKAVAAHPGKSNRAIARDIGVDEGTVRDARRGTAEFSAVRIGLDGKARRVFRRHDNPTPDELVHIPAAEKLIDGITPFINALRNEGKIRETIMSPNRVAGIVQGLLSQIFKSSLSRICKAKACEDCANEWNIDPAKVTKNEIDAVRAAADAWSALHQRLAVAAEEDPPVLREQPPPVCREPAG
ncbi:hypothetical protein GWG65_03510 [Bradyrhizobium sp. CSA207]|uniref:hypothetical protein n=1 Tax=Bradyrhizobium sp. CSA207 TaxID=2698826 RepID=UPI0023B0A552|nr:hypothetical protein [Bradyrhizobium sp. CSA207]MDE5440531.1 hypothetical protein [Bradyrhizobium sp. CSA207]